MFRSPSATLKKFTALRYKLRAEVSTSAQLSEAVADSDYEYVYAPLALLGEDTTGKERIIAVPHVFTGGGEKRLSARLAELKEMGFRSALAHTLGHIEMIKSAGMEIFGGFRLNIANGAALSEYAKLGIKDALLSPEMSFGQIKKLRGVKIGIAAYGAFPVMTLMRCPIKNGVPCKEPNPNCKKSITDRYGKPFPLSCDGTEVFVLNPDLLYLGDKTGDLNSLDFAVLLFTEEERLSSVKEMFLNGENPEKLGRKFTRGLYYKGVD